MNNIYPQNQNFEQPDKIERKKKLTDLIIWWSISAGLLILYFLIGVIEIYGNIYIPYESVLSTTLFGSGILIGIIACTKSFIFAGKRGRWVLISILIIVILLAALFYYQIYKPQKEAQMKAIQELVDLNYNSNYETVDWKIYRNEEYGFELKYPPAWQVVNDNPLTIREWPSISKIGDYWLSVLIYKSEEPLKSENITQWVKKEYMGRAGYQLSDRITGYINGRPVTQVFVEGAPQSPANILTYVINNSSEVLELGCLIAPKLADSNNLCYKILNSIKFIK